MSDFKQYRRTQIAEMRPVTASDIQMRKDLGAIFVYSEHSVGDVKVSISQPDFENGSPKLGDMIARNPKNHNDQWLVAEKYFNDNFEEL
jgi:hypothetical protein